MKTTRSSFFDAAGYYFGAAAISVRRPQECSMRGVEPAAVKEEVPGEVYTRVRLGVAQSTHLVSAPGSLSVPAAAVRAASA
jgi:hypothetical protein